MSEKSNILEEIKEEIKKDEIQERKPESERIEGSLQVSKEEIDKNKDSSDIENLQNQIKELKEQLAKLQPNAPKYIGKEDPITPTKLMEPEEFIDSVYEDAMRKYNTYKNPQINLMEEFVRIAKNFGISSKQIAKDIENNMTGLPQNFAHLATAAKLIK